MGNDGGSLLASFWDKSCPASDGKPHVAVKTMPGILLDHKHETRIALSSSPIPVGKSRPFHRSGLGWKFASFWDKSYPASDGKPHVAVKTMPGILLIYW